MESALGDASCIWGRVEYHNDGKYDEPWVKPCIYVLYVPDSPGSQDMTSERMRF